MAAKQKRQNTAAGPVRGGSAGAKAAAAKRKNKRKLIIFMFEVVVILIMLAALWAASRISTEGPKITKITPEEVAIPSEIQEAKEQGESTMLGYRNIALFGVDATSEKEVEKNSRSDTIMIASINMDTGDIKLVSVYRDTYLNIGRSDSEESDTYTKCNAAYAKGGPTRAIRMLNTNLDMDIEDFVTVGYNSLIDVVDGLGGVWVEIKQNEISYLNDYQKSIVVQWKYGVKGSGENGRITEEDLKVLKASDYTPVKEAGYQLLNGLQAAAYCRIRYVGNDFARTERQRTVLKAIQEEALKASPSTLTKIFNDVVGQVYTSLSKEEMLEMLGKIADFKIVDEGGFPNDGQFVTGNIGASGSCIVPKDLEENVVWLHQFLFDDEDYTVTEGVRERGEMIESRTSKYLNGE
ncbi:MAG: LCP family protein [Firmicutes bacterium]|nr:LCP family protein [Bacillota bacterium]